MLSGVFIVHIFFIASITVSYANNLSNETHPDYGDKCLVFYDEEGNSHVMNFSAMPDDDRGVFFGETYFYLYTRRNTEPEQLFMPSNTDQEFSQYFNSSNLIKVLTHGWFSSGSCQWILNMKDEFLRNYDYNVIIIDWSEFARNPVYPWSAYDTRYVGSKTAQLLDAIAIIYEIDGSYFHLIGHSLGAHVMAHVADLSSLRIHRITGLDAARPLFEFPPISDKYRLDKRDAEFVDLIHTCAGMYGYETSLGHADFYPNGGKPIQPGCATGTKILAPAACSHGRAPEFFTESVNSNLFYAYPCESWSKFENKECTTNFTYMGYQCPMNASGDYFLTTHYEPPYAQGQLFMNT